MYSTLCETASVEAALMSTSSMIDEIMLTRSFPAPRRPETARAVREPVSFTSVRSVAPGSISTYWEKGSSKRRVYGRVES